MQIPDYIQTILSVLERHGFSACVVGGCVRDGLLGRQASDWDVATAARPETVRKLFEKTVPTGIAHGTVTVVLPQGTAEVTTFRTDGVYADGRHPSQVTFTDALRDDLARRDFTVNAMAMDLRGRLYDCFGGQADLRSRCIRCVGDADVRFSEDALRMLRAVRFSAQLEFSVEDQTLAAIKRCAPLCQKLSAERIRDEVQKTLCSAHPERVGQMIALGLLEKLGLSGQWDLSALRTLPGEAVVRWAGLKRLLPQLDLSMLRLDRHTEQTATLAAQAYRETFTELELKRLLAQQGTAVADCAARLSGARALLEQILSSGDCVSLKTLAVNGSDFPTLEGRQVGQMLHRLLLHVLEHPQDNDKQRLLAIAAQAEQTD